MYQPFIGRKEELDALEKLYETEGFQMMVVYGRRRIGKSTLLSHFIRGKKAIFLHGSPQWSPTEFATLEPASP